MKTLCSASVNAAGARAGTSETRDGMPVLHRLVTQANRLFGREPATLPRIVPAAESWRSSART
jgi:hypothetical protein